MIHVGRDHSSAARPPAFDDQIVALDGAVDAGGLEPGGDRGEAIALLDPAVRCKPRIRVEPEAKAAATARIGYSSIIEGARAAGTSTAMKRARAHPQVRDLLAAFETLVERLDMGAHLLQRLRGARS